MIKLTEAVEKLNWLEKNAFKAGVQFGQQFISIQDELPDLNMIVLAKCEYSNGDIRHHIITRIPTKESLKGWQWSGEGKNSYFTLNVISWRPLNYSIQWKHLK